MGAGGIQIDWEGDLIRRHFVCIGPGNNITSVKTTNHQKSFIRNTCGWKSINFLEFLISIIFFPFSIQAETLYFCYKKFGNWTFFFSYCFFILILHVSKKKSQTGNTPEIQNKNSLQVSIAVIIKTHIILIINTIFHL